MFFAFSVFWYVAWMVTDPQSKITKIQGGFGLFFCAIK